MALTFRNLTVTPDDPVEIWPTEAVHTALERGDLHDWQRIASAILRDPWGPTARSVEEILAFTRPYGIAEAMTSVLADARARREADEREVVAAEIRSAIERVALSRRAIAARLGTSASRLSTYAGGSVTPAATFMVRLRRLVDDLSSERATSAE